MRKLSLIFISFILLFGTTFPVFATSTDFSTNEEYYSDLCSSTQASSNSATCNAYQNYVNEKALSAANELEQLRQELKDIKENILEYAKQVTEYQDEIDKLSADITRIEKSITQSEASIAQLENDIALREAHIAEIDAFIKERMVAMQSFLNLNSYFDFIMGAKDFVDLVRRIEGINEITKADKANIDALSAEVEAFNSDKAELERQVIALKENKANLEKNKATQVGLQDAVEKILAEYREQEAELMAKEEYMAANLDTIRAQLTNIAQALDNIIPSAGWIYPIDGSFRVTAGAWTYLSGATHLGIDLGAPVGTALVAVGNGVVIYSSNACPTYGYYGNNCGYPGINRGGNQVYLIVSINNKSYGIIYMHLEKDTPIASGQVVTQGQVIGKVGSSGSSTGPHLHIEVHYLGTKSVSYYATNWNGDLSFGDHWGNSGLPTRCIITGGVAPCRENPLGIFNVNVLSWYEG